MELLRNLVGKVQNGGLCVCLYDERECVSYWSVTLHGKDGMKLDENVIRQPSHLQQTRPSNSTAFQD